MSERPVVHVIDDDEAMRASLVFLLESSDLSARSYGSASEFLEALPKAGGGCVISDVCMPGLSGMDLLRRLRSSENDWPVIVITGQADVPMAVEAMKEGAFDFLEKPFSDDDLLSSVRAALALHRKAHEEDGQRAVILERLETLTAREREVFDGLVAGLPNKTIAYDLGISPRTVEIYRANVMTKLQASSLSEVVRMAFIAEGGRRPGGKLRSA